MAKQAMEIDKIREAIAGGLSDTLHEKIAPPHLEDLAAMFFGHKDFEKTSLKLIKKIRATSKGVDLTPENIKDTTLAFLGKKQVTITKLQEHLKGIRNGWKNLGEI